MEEILIFIGLVVSIWSAIRLVKTQSKGIKSKGPLIGLIIGLILLALGIVAFILVSISY